MTVKEMGDSMYFWGIAIALAFFLFYLCFTTWVVIIVIHDWFYSRCRCSKQDDTSAR